MSYLNSCGCVMSNWPRDEMSGNGGAQGSPQGTAGLGRFDTSLLKTCVQKAIRRGFTADAQAIARAIVRKGESSSLRRRLGVVVAEDSGWQKIWMLPLLQKEMTEEDILKLVAVASEGVHDKSCEPLMGRSRRINSKEGPADLSRFEEALIVGNVSYAARVIVQELDPRESGTGKSPIWKVMTQVAQDIRRDVPDLVEVVQAVKRRNGAGLLTNDRSLLTIATAQALTGKTYDDSPKEGWLMQDNWKQIQPQPSTMQNLAEYWWAMDPHSWVGKIVGAILAKKNKVESVEYLNWCQFCVCSGVVNPARDHAYLEDWAFQIQEKFPGQTLATMTAKWNEIRDDVRGCTIWLLRKRGLL